VGAVQPAAHAPPAAASRGRPGGGSVWTASPDGAPPESRLAVALPEEEFTYIERPWSHFLTRWAAMDVEIERTLGPEASFSLIDLGSCCGFFSLQAAVGYPQCTAVSVEGSVGIGNGTTGVDGSEDDIIETKAIQTHLRWIDKLQLQNNMIAPEVWDYQRVSALAALGRPIADVMISLSVVHHIDNISVEQYRAERLSKVEGTVRLMSKLLQLAPRHFVEMPDRPWMDHMYDAFGTARAFLGAAASASGRHWSFTGPLCISEWYGRRELWLLEEVGQARPPFPAQGLKALFGRTLGCSQAAASVAAADQSRHQARRPMPQPQLQQQQQHMQQPQRQQHQHQQLQQHQQHQQAQMHRQLQQPPHHQQPMMGGGGIDVDAMGYAQQRANVGASAARRPMQPVGQQQQQQPVGQQQQLQYQRQQLQMISASYENNATSTIDPSQETTAAGQLGAAMLAAPTALIAAHVQLRDACAAAQVVLAEAKAMG